MAKHKKPAKSAKPGKRPKSGAKNAGKGPKKKPAATKSPARLAYEIAVNPKNSPQERQAALSVDPTTLCDNTKTFSKVLDILRDPEQPLELRWGALDAIGAARFSAPNFKSCRADYIAALREVAVDADPELRQRSLGFLAREKDGFAQKKLLDGLRKPDKALVPPEKALQLLSYDVHTEAYALAREIVDKPPNSLAKVEALRLLGSDPKSAPLLEGILRDKKEPIENRQICAAALHVINPPKYQEQAREMLLDKEEHPDIQSMSLTALTYFGDKESIVADESLKTRVDELQEVAPANVKNVAKQFRTKYQ